MNATELSACLANNAPSVAEYLFPKGKKHGSEWKIGSIEGEAGSSLSIKISGEKKGIWCDFNTGAKGDLLDAWAHARSCSLADAIRDAKEYLCIVDIVPSRERRPYVQPEKPRCVKPKSIVLEWLRARGFEDRTIEAFKVGASGDDTVVLPYIRDGVFVNVKHRNINDKSKMWQAKDAEPCLFGWHTIGDKSREVAICEGEFDCMALWQIGIEALSVNQGAGNHQWIDSDWERLDRFSKIYLCFDDDAAGKKGVAEVATRLGLERCFVVTFPEKDANDYIKAGASEDDFRSCFKRAATFDPEELVRASAFEDDVVRAFYPPDDVPNDPLLRLGSDHAWFRFRSGEVSVWTGFNGHGKALALDTPVITPQGWKQFGHLHAGDELFDDTGAICRVVAETQVMLGRPCFQLTFSDGSTIVADAEHEWLTFTARARASRRAARGNGRLLDVPLKRHGSDQRHKRTMPSIVTTRQIAETLVVNGGAWDGLINHSIQLSGAIKFAAKVLPIDPYILGAWLGDGNSNEAGMTTADMEMVESFEAAGYIVRKRVNRYAYGIGGGLSGQLRASGLFQNKHIPEDYLFAAPDQRLALLQGLMDTDGSATTYGRCEFSSTNSALALGVRDLVLSFGIQVKIICVRATLYGKDCGPHYRVTFTPNIPVFRLRRKAERLKTVVSERIRHRFIVSCEPTQTVPVKCIQVDSPSHLFLAGDSLIPTHNSLVLGQIILGLLSQDQQACIFSGEMLPTSLLKRLVRQATGYAEPAIPFIRKVARWFNDRLWLFNLTGSAESARLLFVFTYAARRYGIRTFVIDSLMMVADIPEEGKGALEAQRQFMRKIADFAKRYKAHVHLVAHPRKGADEKTGPGKQDTAGSGKITDMADNHWSVWANLRDENEPADDGPDAYLELNKQRHEESQHRKLWLWYDPGSQQYRSLRAAKPMQFVEWSPSEYREEA